MPGKFIASFLFLCCSLLVSGQQIDFTKASLLLSPNIKSPFKEKITAVIQQEIAKRTGLTLNVDVTAKNNCLIILSTTTVETIGGLKQPHRNGNSLPENKPEGFRIVAEKVNGKTILWLLGADNRGLLFSVGRLLATAQLSPKKIGFSSAAEIATAPVTAIRGHQLGYRNTANSWDSWTVSQYDQYIRELALLGTNAIENIPFQGGAPGPLMKVSREEMNRSISSICDSYGLDYWVWTPVDVNLSDTVAFNSEVKKHADFYKNCPRLDDVFVPGGDPGNNDPEYIMPFLKSIAEALKKYHPHAGLWVSLQGFHGRQVDYFFNYLEQHKPDWLAGVVSGPGSPPMAYTRSRLPARYKHRDYPDLTHSVRCQYPVPDWDQAFALTEGREVCNPRPFGYSKIQKKYAGFTDGFISYSDGVHDDVNKVLWTQIAWDPGREAQEIVKDYCSFFFGAAVSTDAATGILALERNWSGPLEENGAVETGFAFWKQLESGNPLLSRNWRWQLLVLRAYYDTYTRRRKLYEQGLEKQANLVLKDAPAIGAERAMQRALALVNKADSERQDPVLRQKIVDYCAALFKSVGLQSSVKLYQASGAERGAILDFLDYPLNNRWWLSDEFARISKMVSETDKLASLEVISSWEQPGAGSYYDNVSNISQSPHVTTHSEDATDVAWWDNGNSRKRLSTQLFQNFPQLVYEDLDPKGDYKIRIAGEGEALLRVDGDRVSPSIYNKELEQFKEFHIASNYLTDGKLVISFDQPEESQLNWRRKSKVCDIWLIKQ